MEIINGKKICTRTNSQIKEVYKEQWFLCFDNIHDETIKAIKNETVKTFIFN